MNIFQRKFIKPKRLSLNEMWELHNLIRYEESDDVYLIDSVLEIMKKMSPKNFFKSLDLMYKNYKVKNGLVAANEFVIGLKTNKFFEFESFLEALKPK